MLHRPTEWPAKHKFDNNGVIVQTTICPTAPRSGDRTVSMERTSVTALVVQFPKAWSNDMVW